jgi:hypothetical protein
MEMAFSPKQKEGEGEREWEESEGEMVTAVKMAERGV